MSTAISTSRYTCGCECKLSLQNVNTFIHTCLVMEGCGGTWWGPLLWVWYDLVAVCLVLDFDLTEAYCSPFPLPRSQAHLPMVMEEKQGKRQVQSGITKNILLQILTALWVPVGKKKKRTYFVDHTNSHQAVTADPMMMVRERTASEKNTFGGRTGVRGWEDSPLVCTYRGQTHIFVRPMWEHRRLVVVHAFIGKVVIDYVDELYKFLSSTKHAFRHLKRKESSC